MRRHGLGPARSSSRHYLTVRNDSRIARVKATCRPMLICYAGGGLTKAAAFPFARAYFKRVTAIFPSTPSTCISKPERTGTIRTLGMNLYEYVYA